MRLGTRPVPLQAHSQGGAFTVQQALAAGWTERTLGSDVARGRLARLRRGVYALAEPAGPPDVDPGQRLLAQRGIAAALRIPAATVSHASAVAVHGLPLLEVPAAPCITLQPPLRTREADLHVHRQPIPPDQLDARYEFPITTVARSCIDLTREQGLAAGLAAADAALHGGLCTRADLEAVYAASCRGRAGLSTGRQLMSAVDSACESPLESISRLAMAGLPPPSTQVTLVTPGGRFLARVDFYWDDVGVVGEADGRVKYADGDELWREKQRQDGLLDHGLVVVRWGWSLARSPAMLRARIEDGFVQARRLRAAGVRPSAIVRPEPT